MWLCLCLVMYHLTVNLLFDLYVLIIAMAIDKYAYDVNALKSPTPAQLQEMLKKRFDIDYTDETISGHLKAARELVALNIE